MINADLDEFMSRFGLLIFLVVATFSTATSFAGNAPRSTDSGFGPVQGPDVVYTWVATTGNPSFPLHLDFIVTPQSGFDPVVYALSELDDGATCVAAIDTFGAGGMELLHVKEQLIPGHRYYLYIDSRNPAALAGDFELFVSTFISVELQSFTIE